MKGLISFVLCIISFAAIIICFEAIMFGLCQLLYAKSEHEELDKKIGLIDSEKISYLHRQINKNIARFFITAICSLFISTLCVILANMITPFL